MKKVILAAFFLVSTTSSIWSQSQGTETVGTTVPAFRLEKNDLQITRLAQPAQYFDKIGPRAGLMGSENGSFEMWIWPWKPFRNFELSFLLGTSTQPIRAADIVRTISVTPEATVFTYTHESFSVREIVFVPREKQGAVLLLDVHTTSQLTIVAGFIPVMQPMWPAGIGGQFSYWNDEPNGYVISEGRWRAIFMCGSPGAKQMAAPPAHMFADNPLQFRIDVQPGETDGKFIPIVIAGGHGMKWDSVKTLYTDLWKNAETYYREGAAYYRQLRAGTIRLTIPDRELNLAFEWGKVALDNLMVRNPNLGYGMVAGFGLSGGGGRPGFAWYFGGDAFINSLAFHSYGATLAIRDAIAFTQKWQRQEDYPIRKNPERPNRDIGKMAHELSQSDGICDWWNDYHYGYNHADTTPWYLVAIADYVRTSGDVEFLKESWPSVKQAYAWCVGKDSDGDGLMDLKGAGLGALEFGKLVGIYSDVYTCAIWLEGIKGMVMMADLAGDAEAKAAAEAQLGKAAPSFEKIFWNEKTGFYSYGATEEGKRVDEKTPWPGIGMFFGLFDEARVSRSLETFNGADLCTDWGVRSLSRSSDLFEPTNYNYGAVWPFIGMFFNTAQFMYGYDLSAYPILKAVAGHAFDNAAGVVPEVFSGEMNQKLGEAYHHQGFSTTGYILPLMKGLVGLEVDALKGTVVLKPRIPASWDDMKVENVRVGERAYDFIVRCSDTTYSLEVTSSSTAGNASPVEVTFGPGLEAGTRAASVSVNGTAISDAFDPRHPGVTRRLGPGDVLTIHHDKGPGLTVPENSLTPGGTNRLMKVVSVKEDPSDRRSLRLTLEGIAGESYGLDVRNPREISSVEGCVFGMSPRTEDDRNGSPEGRITVKFEAGEKQNFVRKEVLIRLKK